MTSQECLEVSACLEKAVERIKKPPDNAEDLYERYEMTAISLLDSDAYLYREDELYHCLRNHLEHIRKKLGLKPLD